MYLVGSWYDAHFQGTRWIFDGSNGVRVSVFHSNATGLYRVKNRATGKIVRHVEGELCMQLTVAELLEEGKPDV